MKYVIYSSLTVGSDYVNAFIDQIRKTCKRKAVDEKGNLAERYLAKLAFNSMIGNLKKKDRHADKRTTLITTDANHAFYYHLHNKGAFI